MAWNSLIRTHDAQCTSEARTCWNYRCSAIEEEEENEANISNWGQNLKFQRSYSLENWTCAFRSLHNFQSSHDRLPFKSKLFSFIKLICKWVPPKRLLKIAHTNRIILQIAYNHHLSAVSRQFSVCSFRIENRRSNWKHSGALQMWRLAYA